jgi:hypothetical protein
MLRDFVNCEKTVLPHGISNKSALNFYLRHLNLLPNWQLKNKEAL